jgi:hypothetical protein
VAADGVEYEVPKYVRVFPPRREVAADLASFLGRGLHLFFIFSGGQAEHFNYRRQHADAFPRIDFDTIRVEHLPDADHILTGLRHQEFVVREVRGWMERLVASFPRQSRSAVAAPASGLSVAASASGSALTS